MRARICPDPRGPRRCCGARLCKPQHVESDRRVGFANTLGGRQSSCGSQASCVRQKICFERGTAFSLPLLLKKEERAGERRCFLSISPLSGSLPARSSRGERGRTPQAFCVPNTTGRRPALLSLGLAVELCRTNWAGCPQLTS